MGIEREVVCEGGEGGGGGGGGGVVATHDTEHANEELWRRLVA